MNIISAHLPTKSPELNNTRRNLEKTDAVAFFDENLTIYRVNSSFYQLTGFSNYDPVNTSLLTLPIWDEQSLRQIPDALNHTDCHEFGAEIDYLYQGEIPFRFSVSIVKNNPTVDNAGVLILKDITQEKLNSELQKQQPAEQMRRERERKKLIIMGKQLQDFLYVASHDLKEPLRIIGNFSQLLNRQCHGFIDDTGREYLSFIMNGVRGMNNLIDDLLRYSELDSRPHQRQEIHFPTMLFMLKKMQHKTIKAVGGKLTVQNMDGVITGDKEKIRLLFESLLSNSIKFRHPDRPLEVLISGEETETHRIISFKDNGIGIQKEFFGKIFEMFKKLHGKQVYQGTGIGLAICKKVVNQHHGTISVASVFNEGTVFTFSLQK